MKIDIWMDITCPFCYIGTTQLNQAMQGFEHKDNVHIIHHSFQLDPEAPTETDTTLNEMLARKKGISLQQAEQLNNHVTELAASVGLLFAIEKVIPVNSFNAHQLLHLATRHGKQSEMLANLFKAYFQDGYNIASLDTLVKLSSEVGLDPENVKASIERNDYADEVRADISQAATHGITGVPFFVIDDAYTISGAQGTDVFAEALRKNWN